MIARALWPVARPSDERHAVQTIVSRLRRALGQRRNDLANGSDGYRLAVTADNCDLVRFEALVARATHEAPEAALSSQEEALALWRGPAFGSLGDIEAIRPEAVRLNEQRLRTIENRFQLLLDLARSSRAIPELAAFVAAEPLRERARGQLMQALHWSGWRQDALRCYQEYLELLGEQQRLEPSPLLRTLQEAILDDSLTQVSTVSGGKRTSTRTRGRDTG